MSKSRIMLHVPITHSSNNGYPKMNDAYQKKKKNRNVIGRPIIMILQHFGLVSKAFELHDTFLFPL